MRRAGGPAAVGRRGRAPRARAHVGWVAAGSAGLALAAAAPAPAQSLPETDDCVACHLDLADSTLAAPARAYPSDIHAQRGFGCLVCHGGPRTGRGELDPDAGFLGTPARRAIPTLCGRCHSDAAFMRDYDPGLRVDQVEEYFTSVHGRRLREENDPDVATCVSCHPAHATRPPSELESSVHPLRVGDLCGSCHADEALMGPRGEPTDQLEAYRSGVHGHLLYEEGDVSAPTCNDCHGNHGAAPPGVSAVRNVCGQCHTIMADFFAGSGHLQLFEEAGLPGCATCHGNHDIEPTSDADLVTRTEGVCLRCHEERDPDGAAFLVVSRLLDSLTAERTRAREVLEEAENAGMEVSQALFELQAVDNALTMARSAVHAFRVEPVGTEIDNGLAVTSAARQRGREAMDEHAYRRVGLGVSAAIILLLVVSLLLRIRRIESTLPPTPAEGGR